MAGAITIEVTQEDIDKGICSSATRCAIARAVRRITRRRYVYVTDNRIIVAPSRRAQYDESKANKVCRMGNPPKKVKTFIQKFDQDKTKVKPFSFVFKCKP
jgi:hypothetical protein